MLSLAGTTRGASRTCNLSALKIRRRRLHNNPSSRVPPHLELFEVVPASLHQAHALVQEPYIEPRQQPVAVQAEQVHHHQTVVPQNHSKAIKGNNWRKNSSRKAYHQLNDNWDPKHVKGKAFWNTITNKKEIDQLRLVDRLGSRHLLARRSPGPH